MALVPEQGSGKLTALLMLGIAVILVYMVCFHWFVMSHVEYSEEISGLSEQLGRFEEIASRRADYQAVLSELQSRRADESLFLEGDDFNEAAAGMSERLNQMIRTQTEDTCQIVSRQPVRPRVEERYQRVTVNARMRCGIEDLTKIVYSLETGAPMILTEELTVIKPRSRARSSANVPQNPLLDIRFNMSGYLRDTP